MHAPELNWEHSKREKRNRNLIWTSFSVRLSIRWQGNKWGLHFRKFCQSLFQICPPCCCGLGMLQMQKTGSCSCASPDPALPPIIPGTGLQIYRCCSSAPTHMNTSNFTILLSPQNPHTLTALSAFFGPPHSGNHLLRPRNLLLGLIRISYNVELVGVFFFFLFCVPTSSQRPALFGTRRDFSF